MTQMHLDFCAQPTLRERADQWIVQNPKTYRLFLTFALRAARRGEKFGAKLIAERVRWECFVEKSGQYKVNNNYVAYIARRMIEEHPELEQHLQTREVRS